jgi:CDP-diacylglycerol--glycerol-3-phosphate 3-phosphatidyltransferase
VNLPNALTVLRLLLVPVFVVLLFLDGGDSTAGRIAAFVVFIVASLTDLVDGAIARSRGQVTDFGKIADPIADKALTGAALIGLSILGDLPWWVTVVILVREVGITLLRFSVIRTAVIPAGRGGKLKTVLQMVAISLYLLPLPATLDPISAAVMGVALLVTVVTGIDYLRVVRQVRAGTVP